MRPRHPLLYVALATAWALCACGGDVGDEPVATVAAAPEEAGVPAGAPDPGESVTHRVLYLTNLERRAGGLAPLRGQLQLEAAAQGHAADMGDAEFFDHQSLDGRSPWDRLGEAGYAFRAAGENIAAGQPTAEEVVEAWMNSPGHRANILNPSFRELGVGYHLDEDDAFPGPYGYRHYWVQAFGSRSGSFPLVIENEAHRTDEPVVSIFLHGEGWAEEMRVSEAPEFVGATWVPFAAEISWELSEGNGLKQVCAELRRGDAATAACDSIWLE